MPNWTEIPVNSAPRTRRPNEPAASRRPDEQPAEAGVEPARFVARQPVRTMTDLVVPAAVQARLELAVRQLDHHKVLYDEWNLRRIDPHRAGTALNFYGEPGTGKSLAAEAIAHHRNRPFIDINYAEIESKYVGETPKNIVACFRQAEQHGAVLVFNEADSILGSRLSNVTQSADHSVNVSRAVMLSQLDSFGGLVIFTTNFPRNYDAAFVRRILVHVRFELPDAATRRRLWERLIPAELPCGERLDFEELAERSAGLAGGDMVNVILAAAAQAVGRPEPQRRLLTSDLLAEIETVRIAKTEVGKPSGGPRVISVDRFDSAEEAGAPLGASASPASPVGPAGPPPPGVG